MAEPEEIPTDSILMLTLGPNLASSLLLIKVVQVGSPWCKYIGRITCDKYSKIYRLFSKTIQFLFKKLKIAIEGEC